CVYTPSGLCDITGTVHYYRDGSGGSEPSTKPVANVSIDDSADSSADATTDVNGNYALNDLVGNVTVRTLPKYGDTNDAVTAFDALLIAQHSVHKITLSGNQQIAGDVSGNGVVSAYDAGLVSEFAVQSLDHLPVATTN